MKRYPEQDDDINWLEFPFTKFKIVVPTQDDKKEIIDACKHLHDSDIDTGYVTVNQIAHIYQDDVSFNPVIIVDENLYNSLNKLDNKPE